MKTRILTLGRLQFGFRLKPKVQSTTALANSNPKAITHKIFTPPSVDEMKMTILRTSGCVKGSCTECSNDCRINEYKKIIGQRKPSFCPDDKSICLRKKMQGCKACRNEYLDYNVKSDYSIVHNPQPHNQDPVSIAEVVELERLAATT